MTTTQTSCGLIRGRFDEVAPLVYEYAYFQAYTRAMQTWPYSTHIEDM